MSTERERRKLLVTAGPTHEPLDAVRYLANRSSGRLGIEIAEAAAEAGWAVTLLLGPTPRRPADTRIHVVRFRTAADLRGLLSEHQAGCDALVMAAAVADFRPIGSLPGGKIRRGDGVLTIELEPVPDLLGECSSRRSPGQILVGFALEPEDRLIESASEKLRRKGVNAIVANPLETMDSPTIRATIVRERAGEPEHERFKEMPKAEFARELLRFLDSYRD